MSNVPSWSKLTIKQAAEIVRRFDSHLWAYEVAHDGIVVVGGQDHKESIHHAKQNGERGPFVHVYSVEK